jgi:hypothetical protein
MGDRAYTEANRGTEFTADWLTAYLDHQRYSESPEQFHFWTGVSTIAGALRRRVWIDQRHFQWTPNMYIVLVGPPGVAAKSTSLKGGHGLLEAVRDAGITFGPQSMTWQALIAAFKASHQTLKIEGVDQPVSMSCLTVGVSELGTFLDPQDRPLVDFLTDMWDGQQGPWRRRIKGEGEITLHSPWLNLIACTTPAWLAKNFPEDLVGGGLTSRIVFVYGDTKRNLIPYPAERITGEDYEIEKLSLIHDLKQIAELSGEYKLTPPALEWGEKWYRSFHNGGLPSHLANSRFEGYVARKQSHIHKLAMVLAASRRDALVITAEDLIEAERRISDLEREMLRVFESIGKTTEARVTSEVLTLIKNYRTIDSKTLWRICMKTHDDKTFRTGIASAISAGYVEKVKIAEDNWKLTYVGDRKA